MINNATSFNRNQMYWVGTFGFDISKFLVLQSNTSLHFHIFRPSQSSKNVITEPFAERHHLRVIQFSSRVQGSRFKCSKCTGCSHSPTTVGHLFWSLTDLSNQFSDTFSHIFNKTINPNLCNAIFGVLPSKYKPSKHQSNALAFASLLVRPLILTNWKSTISPSFLLWIEEMMKLLPLEKIRYSTSGTLTKFNLKWSPFINYVVNLLFIGHKQARLFMFGPKGSGRTRQFGHPTMYI